MHRLELIQRERLAEEDTRHRSSALDKSGAQPDSGYLWMKDLVAEVRSKARASI